MTLKAIQTAYRGITYRSRTEARWALYLDELGVAYSYEAEGFDLGGDWYLPDFWLPSPGVWLEIKGVQPNEREIRVAQALSKASRCPVLVAVGTPSIVGDYNLLTFRDGEQGPRATFADYGRENLFIASECQSLILTVRGSKAALGGAPEPCASAARLAAAERFGVHE